MASKVCESCGEPVASGVQFCTNCGFFLDWSEQGEEEPSPVPRTRPRAVQESPSTQSESAATTEEIRPVAVARPKTPSGTPCPACATPNPVGRRFCSHCGRFIGTPSDAGALRAFAPPNLPWWRRWLFGRPGSERAARTAYRRSLPWPVRMRRALIALGVLLLGLGYLHFVGRDPVSWARHQVDALRGTLVKVPDVTARAPAGSSPVPDFPATAAVDGDKDTAWAIPFAGPQQVSGSACTAVSDTNGLLLSMPQEVTLRAMKVHGGFPGPDAQQRWRPRTLELWFPDGKCQRVNLVDTATPQQLRIHAVRANAVRIAVVAGYPPQGGGSNQAYTAITEIALLTRPK
jgi:hypothetical protein